jgi:hypothetical protein
MMIKHVSFGRSAVYRTLSLVGTDNGNLWLNLLRILFLSLRSFEPVMLGALRTFQFAQPVNVFQCKR